jgi:hypothetical protein
LSPSKDYPEPRVFPTRGSRDAGRPVCGDDDRQHEAPACALGDLANESAQAHGVCRDQDLVGREHRMRIRDRQHRIAAPPTPPLTWLRALKTFDARPKSLLGSASRPILVGQPTRQS